MHTPARPRPAPWRTALAVLALPALALLHGCGSNEDAQVRVLNAAPDYASLDLYDGTTETLSATATQAVSSYAGLDAGSHTFNLRNQGGGSTAATLTATLKKQDHYTLVAWQNGSTLTQTLLSDELDSPDSGNARLRFFHTASTGIGAVDIYVGSTACASLAATDTPVLTALSGLQDGYTDVKAAAAGTAWHLCVTATGDRSDVRLDVPAFTLTSGQVGNLVLTQGSGGVLLNGLLLNQQGTLSNYANSSARLRLVADAAGNAVVAATLNGTTLTAGLSSPTVGTYKLVTAGTLSGTVTIGGVGVTLPVVSVKAGADLTLLVAGTAAAPTLSLIADDNTPSTVSSRPVRVRLLNGLNGSSDAAVMTIDGDVLADGVAFGAASTATNTVATSASSDIEVTVGAGTVFSASSQTLVSGKVYTLFLLGDQGGSVKGVLRAN